MVCSAPTNQRGRRGRGLILVPNEPEIEGPAAIAVPAV